MVLTIQTCPSIWTGSALRSGAPCKHGSARANKLVRSPIPQALWYTSNPMRKSRTETGAVDYFQKLWCEIQETENTHTQLTSSRVRDWGKERGNEKDRVWERVRLETGREKEKRGRERQRWRKERDRGRETEWQICTQDILRIQLL